jgi:Nickel responsive protein SCO4226-like
MQKGKNMPKFVIERDMPEAGSLSAEQLQAISQKSCGILREMGPQIQWVESYVTDHKIYCVYMAPDEDTVRRHAQQGGFPADHISQVRAVIDPTTAE